MEELIGKIRKIKSAIATESNEAAEVAKERDKVMPVLKPARFIDLCDKQRIQSTYHKKILNLSQDVFSMEKHLQELMDDGT